MSRRLFGSLKKGKKIKESRVEGERALPIRRMVLAYATLSLMILAISGKCQPYHSFERNFEYKRLSRNLVLYLDPHGVDVDFLV